jgi:DNA-binding transcriptional ArsR family regulator
MLRHAIVLGFLVIVLAGPTAVALDVSVRVAPLGTTVTVRDADVAVHSDAAPSPPPAPPAPPASDPSLLPIVDEPLAIDLAPVTEAVFDTVDEVQLLAAAPTEAPAAAEEPAEDGPLEVVYVGHAPPAPLVAAPSAALVAVAAVTAAAPLAGGFGWERLRRLALAAALYTRIAKERLLDHTGRERLVLAVREHPGAAVTDLAVLAGIPRNTAVYHLRRLEREGLVSSSKNGRMRLYFAPGAEQRSHAPALAVLRHPTTQQVATAVGATPGIDQRALCERLGLAPSLAHWHATRLVSAGVVTRERDGRHVRYYPAR